MQSAIYVTLHFEGGGGRGLKPMNVIDKHYGVVDGAEAIGQSIWDIGLAVYHGFTGEWKSVAEDIKNLYARIAKGADKLAKADASLSISKDGRYPGVSQKVKQVSVVFAAWSEDEIKAGAFGRVDPAGGIQDIGAKQAHRNDIYRFQQIFRIDLDKAGPGEHIFAFGACDDGWYFDVAVASTLTVGIDAVPAVPRGDEMRQLMAKHRAVQPQPVTPPVPVVLTPKHSTARPGKKVAVPNALEMLEELAPELGI